MKHFFFKKFIFPFMILTSQVAFQACAPSYTPAYLVVPQAYMPYPAENQTAAGISGTVALARSDSTQALFSSSRVMFSNTVNKRWFRLGLALQFYGGGTQIDNVPHYNGHKNFWGAALLGEGYLTLPLGPLKLGVGMTPSLYFESGSYAKFLEDASADGAIVFLKNEKPLLFTASALAELTLDETHRLEFHYGIGLPGFMNTGVALSTQKGFYWLDPWRLVNGMVAGGVAIRF